jgi:hypothetical protein
MLGCRMQDARLRSVTCGNDDLRPRLVIKEQAEKAERRAHLRFSRLPRQGQERTPILSQSVFAERKQ